MIESREGEIPLQYQGDVTCPRHGGYPGGNDTDTVYTAGHLCAVTRVKAPGPAGQSQSSQSHQWTSQNIFRIVPLGNLNPPGHVFPTDQIYFYISNPNGDNRRAGSGTLQDLPGTAQGCWFLSGVSDTYPGPPLLAFVRSNIHSARAVLLVENSTLNLDSQNVTANN